MNRKELIEYLREYFDELIENEEAIDYESCLKDLIIDVNEDLKNG